MRTSLQVCNPLGPEDLQRIDETGQRILSRVGLKIGTPEYLDMLENAGARVDRDRPRVYFDKDWLCDVLKKAPSRLTLYSRDGKNDIALGSGKVHFVNGGRVFRVLDMGTGGYRRTMLRDVTHTAILVEHLDNIRFYIIACQAHDLKDPATYHLNDFYEALNHTQKHVMGGCDNLKGLKPVWDMVCLIAGSTEEFKERPFISIISNPISPLTIGHDTLDIIRFCTTHGIPVTCAPAPIAGTTAPGTLAGTLAQLHAEALAGVAIAQVFSPGAGVLYGAVPTIMDLRNMDFAIGSVEMAMMNAAAVGLAKLHNLPIYASGGVTEAKRPDIQAGAEKTFSSLLVAMAGADCIHLAAGMLDSGNSISYEQYVIDNEIIGMILRMLKGIKVDDETLGLEVIEKVGPGGHYMTEDHTVNHMMDEFFYPDLSVRSLFDVWEHNGRPDMLSRAKERVEEILRNNKDGVFEPEMIAELKNAFPELIG